MEDQVEIHAYHGWGMSSSFWDNFKQSLPKDIIFKAADRGYFGGDFEPEFHPETIHKVVFTHSFGLHWCPREKFEEIDYLVVFNGFQEFLPKDWVQRRQVSKTIRAMVGRLKVDPGSVLQKFYENCSYPNAVTFRVSDWMNKSKLVEDLKSLKNSKFVNPKHSTFKSYILSSQQDKVYNYLQSNDLYDLMDSENKHVFQNDGHSLPFVNSDECWSFLIRVIPIFEGYGSKNDS